MLDAVGFGDDDDAVVADGEATLAVFLQVVANLDASGDLHSLVDDRSFDARVTTDVDPFEKDRIFHVGVTVYAHARVKGAIIDKGVKIPAGVEIGYDLEKDRERGFTISDNGIVVIAKADGIEHMQDTQLDSAFR